MKRTLTLSREHLADLTPEELSGLRAGGADTPTVLTVCDVVAHTGFIRCHTGATTRYAD